MAKAQAPMITCPRCGKPHPHEESDSHTTSAVCADCSAAAQGGDVLPQKKTTPHRRPPEDAQ